MSPTVMFTIAGISGTLFVLISLYWIYEALTGIRMDIHPLLEDVIEMMEIAGIEYNKELYTEVYFFAKGLGPKFRYNGRRVENAISTLKDVKLKLSNGNYKDVYTDMCEVIEALEDYYEKQERLGKL